MTSGGPQARSSRRKELWRGRYRQVPEARADGSADQTVMALCETHYRSLVRLAALLVGDAVAAEEMVQDSFAALRSAWQRRDSDSALSYLRQSVVRRSRSALRRRDATASAADPPPGTPHAERHAMTGLEHPAVITELRALPARQRETLVLRYYADLSEVQIATVMGVSRRAVKSHLALAMTALRTVLDRAEE
jgi:RNA polymerase sigma-70 factor (sigma-E family)